MSRIVRRIVGMLLEEIDGFQDCRFRASASWAAGLDIGIHNFSNFHYVDESSSLGFVIFVNTERGYGSILILPPR